jgi:GNAT superfamily N-acetyltransferase
MDVLRIDENLFEFYAFAASASRKPIERREGFSSISLNPSPWANTVYDLKFPANRDLPLVLSEEIRSGKLPNQIRIGPTSCPADIESRLAEAGFAFEYPSRGMFLDMDRREAVRAKPGLSLRFVEDEEDFNSFAEIVASELFEKGPESAAPFASILRALDRDRAFGLLGSYHGRPVSTSFAFIDGEGEGGLYFVATEKAMRGRGFARATVGATLEELERRGASTCILQATDLGKPVYESLGFEDACPLARYRLPKTGAPPS